jgi:hypothetical protein
MTAWNTLVTALLLFILLTLPAAATEEASPARGVSVVTRIDDYPAASAKARETGAMLLVSIEPQAPSETDVVGVRLAGEEMQRLFMASDIPWVTCRLEMESADWLLRDPALVEMRGGAGVFLVDYAHDSWRGRIVSVLPRTPGSYYRFEPHHVDLLLTLPEGSLTQRSLILAVRLHAEQPRSTTGVCDPVLCRAAESHSGHQARIHRQGHHNWQTRSQRLGGAASEVCAESWEHQDLLDSCVDCVASWRHSPGHWRAVSSPHAAYGYDIRRGNNSIWYATGIFVH